MSIHSTHFKPGPAGRHGFKVLRIIGLAVAGVAFAVLFAFLFGLVVKVLWNWLMPPLFGLGTIGYWQAFGLVLLAKLLFGGLHHGRGDHGDRVERHFHDRFKRFRHDEEAAGDEAPFAGNGERWRQFREYWREEGQEAFESYLRRKADGEAEKTPED
ncbi:MAG: hypothetical protein JW742_07165 [Candidatus Aminicenantes bacterium]|nr:hypothetical protein [Candidatus Aminicenantes bacterium]